MNNYGTLPDNPPIWLFWMGCGLIILMVVIFTKILKKKKTLHEREIGRIPIYTDNKCGGNLGPGGTDAFSSPFVRVSVYEDFLVISTSFKIVLEISEIEKFKEFWLSKTSLKLYHSNSIYASPLLIGSKKIKKLREVIEAQMAKQRALDESDGGKTGE